MSESPAAQIEDSPRGPRRIEGVATSTAGFVGAAERGPVAAPTKVSGVKEFVRAFGEIPPDPLPGSRYLPWAVRSFFDNGGRECFVVRVGERAAAGGSPGVADYIGHDRPGHRSGIHALEDVPEVRVIAAPGCTDAAVQQALISQCERLRDRFAILDCERVAGSGALAAHRGAYDTSFAAYYAPWLVLPGPEGERIIPPSGAIAGVYARIDAERGVQKAPANEEVRGVTSIQAAFAAADQDSLGAAGINLIRAFAGRGILVWGDRTLSSDPQFRYVSVRRLLIFLESSIEQGTRWAVFEPNSQATWDAVASSVQQFLLAQWRGRRLLGSKPEEAFFVRCDRTTMTQSDLDQGRLVCLVGIAPVRPAEFVIFRIGQWTAERG